MRLPATAAASASHRRWVPIYCAALHLAADFPAIPASVIYRVQTDLAFREEWDTYCEECVSLGHQADGCELVYWLVAYPWPLTKRDYVYGRCLQEPDTDTGPYVVASRACPLGEHCPENEEYVRVCTFTSELTITPVASGGCKMKLLYQDDPRGSLPKRVVNWAATKGFASAMQDLVRAAEMAMNINMNMKERRAQAGD